MEKLDVKDRKILYELDINSRQSFTQLSKKVGLHKDVVAYRVKKLQEKGIIKNFYADISNSKLGYIGVKFYLSYKNVTPEIKNEIIEYLVKNPYTQDVHSAEGPFDLCVISYVENVAKFYHVWKDITSRYTDYFSDQIFCVQNAWGFYKLTFLLNEKPDKKDNRVLNLDSAEDKKVELDSLDKKILEQLVLNSRVKTLEIAEKLNSTVNTINSRIKKLLKTGVIFRYTISIDWPKIGYQWYKADVVLKDPKKMQQVLDYITTNPNLFARVSSLGYVDLELIFCLNNASQLHQIMEDVTAKFPDAIKNYKYSSATKTHKFEGVDFWNR